MMTTDQAPPKPENGWPPPAAVSPERVIRRYLDEHRGETDATVGQLLTSFGVDEGDQPARDRITDALRDEGVRIGRHLPFLGTDEAVHLSVEDSLEGRPRPHTPAGGSSGETREQLLPPPVAAVETQASPRGR